MSDEYEPSESSEPSDESRGPGTSPSPTERMETARIIASTSTPSTRAPHTIPAAPTEPKPAPTTEAAALLKEDRYELQQELGVGTLSRVFRGWDRTLARDVAVRVLRTDLGLDDATFLALTDRMLLEARSQAALYHPHVAPIYDVQPSERYGLYLVGPFFDGKTLRARLSEERVLANNELSRLALELGSALGTAHESGVLHRDLKPECIFQQKHGLVIADFGTSRLTDTAVSVLAIPHSNYTSPETMSRGVYTARNDQYAMALILREACTGAIDGDESGLPNAVRRVLARGAARKAEDRFASCRDLGAAFARALALEASEGDRVSSSDSLRPLQSHDTPGPASVRSPLSTRLGTLVSGAAAGGALSPSASLTSGATLISGKLAGRPPNSGLPHADPQSTRRLHNALMLVGLATVIILLVFFRSRRTREEDESHPIVSATTTASNPSASGKPNDSKRDGTSRHSPGHATASAGNSSARVPPTSLSIVQTAQTGGVSASTTAPAPSTGGAAAP
jgi:serine/threonine protein kinase